jgi:hypothetical protein
VSYDSFNTYGGHSQATPREKTYCRSCAAPKGVRMTIRKLPGQQKFRLTSKTTKRNLGTFTTRKQAEKHEQEINFFKVRARLKK